MEAIKLNPRGLMPTKRKLSYTQYFPTDEEIELMGRGIEGLIEIIKKISADNFLVIGDVRYLNNVVAQLKKTGLDIGEISSQFGVIARPSILYKHYTRLAIFGRG